MQDAKHAAFAAALEELFSRYPVPKYEHEIWYAVRETALRRARDGLFYSTSAPVFYRQRAEDLARTDWGVPPEEVVAIHTLIYG